MTTELVLDPAARRYAATGEGATRDLPDIVQRVEVSLVPAPEPEAAARIRFFADGTATGGTIRLWHGARSATITVDWLTGRVRRDG
jgi:general secretion pathway protein H